MIPRFIFKTIAVLSVLSGCLMMFFAYSFLKTYILAYHQFKTDGQHVVTEAVVELAHYFSDVKQSVADATLWLKTHHDNKEDVDVFLREFLNKNAHVQAVAVAFEPFVSDKQKRLDSRFLVRDKEGATVVEVPYDYTQKSTTAARTDWYIDALAQGSCWTEPYWGTAIKHHIMTRSECFYAADDSEKKHPIGVFSAVCRLDSVREMVGELALGFSEYGFVITRSGLFVTHPIEDFYRKGRSIFDIARERSSRNLEKLAHKMVNSQDGYGEYVNEVTGHNGLLFYKAVPGTHLILCGLLDKEATMVTYTDVFRKKLISLLVSFVLFFLCLLFLGLSFYRYSDHYVVLSACASVILFSLGTCALWVVLKGYPNDVVKMQKIVDKNTINNVVLSCADSLRNVEAPIKIETGVLITDANFLDLKHIRLSGYVWQNYPLTCGQDIIRDVFFVNCIKFSERRVVFHEKQENRETITWFFHGDFVQDSAAEKTYPLDMIDINIILDHPSLDKNVILVPDLDGYSFTNPKGFPGLTAKIRLPSWTMRGSYFSFLPVELKTDLGVDNLYITGRKYQMMFSINAVRDLFDPLLLYLLPLLVALILLFVNVLSASPEKIITNISLASGIWLGIVFTHAALRRVLIGAGLFYLEYFYIVSYLLIILVLIDLVLYAQRCRWFFIRHRNNYLAKILFWPFVTGAVFFITAYVFFS